MLGFILLIFEMFTLSFVVVFFGIAALCVALLKYTTGLSNVTVELLIFAAIGGACLLFFRKKLRKTFLKRGGIKTDEATVFELSQPIAAHKTGKIEYQGSIWDAYNDSDADLPSGVKVIIVRTEGIRLVIRPFVNRQ